MRGNLPSIFLIVFCLQVLLLSGLQAADLTGSIGVDLDKYGFNSNPKDTAWSYLVNRSRTSHFLNLNLNGNLGTSYLGNYSTRLNIFGVYFDSRISADRHSEYIQPRFGSFDGTLNLLPDKPFPLKLYYSNLKDYDLRFEANNRSDRRRLEPALSVVRKYFSDRSRVGGLWQIKPSQNMTILTEYKEESSMNSRLYDFGENRDLWVSYRTSPGFPIDTLFYIQFKNQTEGNLNIQIINLDSLAVDPTTPPIIIEDIEPGMNVVDTFAIGRTEIKIFSSEYNTIEGIIDLKENFIISIIFRATAPPNDIDQKNNTFTGLFKYDGDGKFSDEANYEYGDMYESIQNQKTFLNNLANRANYKISDMIDLSLLTTYTQNNNRIDTISSQLTKVFMNQTVLSFSKRRGLSANLMHSYNNNYSAVGLDTLRSTLNLITTRLSYPINKFNYRFDIRNNLSMLSNNMEYKNNQYNTEIGNSMAFNMIGILIQPKHTFKYAYNSQENPNKNSKEIESKFGIHNEYYSQLLGNLKFKTEYDYRDRWDDFGSDTKGRYLLDFTAIKKLQKNYRLTFATTHEWETFGGSSSGSSGSSSAKKASEYKSSYRFDLQASMFNQLTFNGNYMLISQGKTSIQKIGLSLIATVPLLNIPIKSFILNEIREIAGLPKQTQFYVETKISYNIHKIAFTLKHVYRHESQIFETFSSHEFLIQLTRQFSVF